jgi:hypothetical protein
MKERILKYVVLGIALLFAGNSFGQSIIVGQPINSAPNRAFGVAYIDSNHPVITMSPTISTAGFPLPTPSNSDLYLRTSVYQNWSNWFQMGSIRAELSSGSLPPGTTMTAVSASCTTTSSGGYRGTPVGLLTLSNSYQTLVTSIATSYTGTGDMDGYQVTFSLNPSNYGQLRAGTYNVGVRFYIYY